MKIRNKKERKIRKKKLIRSMQFQVTNLAGEAISEMSSDMITKSVTEQPVVTIYFKGTTSSI
ncbi:MAG: hypothetical protein HWN67_09610 [Candidatus Helarchaeota archaeon]|nr:hypothetical protein [Candidatus Helarchaeota archaeon]